MAGGNQSQQNKEVFKEKLEQQEQKLARIQHDVEQKNQQEELETLQDTLENIREELDVLKENALSSFDAEKEKQKFQGKINQLQEKAKGIEQQITEKVKKILGEFEKEVQKTVAKVSVTDASGEMVNPTTTIGETKKSFFGRTIDWVKGSENEEYHTAKAIGRGALVGTGVYFAFKGVQSLWKGIFGGKKEKSEGKEKKGFWGKAKEKIWKAIKYAGIGIAGVFGIKWLLDYFSNKENKVQEPETQIDKYDSLENIEKMKYEKVGEQINIFYGNIWKNERKIGYEDDNILGTIGKNIHFVGGKTGESYKGLVPYCIDEDSDNIKDILSERDINEYIFSKNYKALKLKVKDWTTDQLEKLLGPFVTKLESFQTFGIRPGKKLGENIKDWLNDEGEMEKREQEMNFFFRQYSKVLTYITDKKTSLEYMLAEKELSKNGYVEEDGTVTAFPTDPDEQYEFVQEVLEDENWVKKYLENNVVYQNFLSSNLMNIQEVLGNNKLDNTEFSKELNENIIEKYDKKADSILKTDKDTGKNIFDECEADFKNGKLSEGVKEDLLDSCDDIRDDMVDSEGTGFFQNTFSSLSYMLNLDDSNKELFLEQTGLKKFSDIYVSQIKEVEDKIKNNTATKEDISGLKKLTQKYLAFKKELEVAVYTIGSIRSDSPDIPLRIGNILLEKFKQFSEYTVGVYRDHGWGGVAILGAGVLVGGYIVKKAGKYILKKTVGKTLEWSFKGVMAGGEQGYKGVRYLVRRGLGMKGLPQQTIIRKIKNVKNLADKQRLLRYYLYNGMLDPTNKGFLRTRKNVRILMEEVFSGLSGVDIGNKTVGEIIEFIDPKLKGYGEIMWEYGQDKNLRRLFLDNTVRSDASTWNKIIRSKKDIISGVDTKVLQKIKEIDEIAKKSPQHTKKITEVLKKTKSVESLDNLKRIINNPTSLSKLGELKVDDIVKNINKSSSTEKMSSLAKNSETIVKSQKNLEAKIAKVFADFEKELAEQATKVGVKKGTNEYKKLAQSVRESSNYGGNKAVQNLLEQHNNLVKKTEQELLKQFNTSDWVTKQKLYKENTTLKKIVEANGGLKSWRFPRAGRVISVGIHAVMLGWIGSSENEKGEKKDWGEIGLDATDFGLGMVPVAGGLYDVGMAFYGKDLNGREMGTAERWIRGGVGLGSAVVDVFTFGLGGTAIRGVVKGGTKIALKTGTKAVVKEGAEIASKGVAKGFAKQLAKNAVRDIIVGTTAGLALVPVINTFDKVKIDENNTLPSKSQKNV